MPDTRSHRGPHPEDHRLFSADKLPRLKTATGDLSWLLGRGYTEKAALKLVGDRFQLDARQRTAVRRCACSDADLQRRHTTCRSGVKGETIYIDGYNLLTTVESALGGGVVLFGRDGAARDVAELRGTYRTVEETVPAMTLIGEVLKELGVQSVVWYLDEPVSNSGKLAARLREHADAAGLSWKVEVVRDPDSLLCTCGGIVVSADSVILNSGVSWVNLARRTVEKRVPRAFVVSLEE